MASPDPNRLRDACRLLLTAAAAQLAAPPDRQYVSAGLPTVDCALLAVWVQGIRTVGLPQPAETPGRSSEVVTRLVTFGVDLWTPLCASERPSEEEVNDDGEQYAVDGWRLYSGLLASLRDGTVFASLTRPEITKASNVTLAEVQDPSDFAGWRVSLEVVL